MDILPKSRRFGRPSLPGRLGRRGERAARDVVAETATEPGAAGPVEAGPVQTDEVEPVIDLTEQPVRERRAPHGRHELPRGRQSAAVITERPSGPAALVESEPAVPMTRVAARAARTAPCLLYT
jgi:hypothetical protein